MAITLHPSFAVHPGTWLRAEIVEPHGLSVTVAAEKLRVTRQAMSNLLGGRAGLSAEMAIRFEKAFGVRADFGGMAEFIGTANLEPPLWLRRIVLVAGQAETAHTSHLMHRDRTGRRCNARAIRGTPAADQLDWHISLRQRSTQRCRGAVWTTGGSGKAADNLDRQQIAHAAASCGRARWAACAMLIIAARVPAIM